MKFPSFAPVWNCTAERSRRLPERCQNEGSGGGEVDPTASPPQPRMRR